MGYETAALSPLRQVIASRMVDAKQNIPHYRVSADIELDALLALRKDWNTQHPDERLSVNDFVIKGSACALMEVPQINIQLVDDEILHYDQADIAVVVAVEGGLSTPVIRNADTKSVQAISREVKTLAEKAANNTLKMSEIVGGTFSISNLGMYDVAQFDAIINSPQCGILAVATAKPQAIIREGEMVAATVMRLSLSLDHRAIDGADGAKFLMVLKQHLENPTTLIGSAEQ